MEDQEQSYLTRLRDGISLKTLLETGQEEFTIAPGEGDLWEESDAERSVETLYEYEDYEKLVNLDCIQAGPEDLTGVGSPFDKIRMKMTKVTPCGKVMKQVIQKGTTKIPENAAVYLHYNFYLEMQEIPFDSTELRQGKPMRLQLGESRHILGFEIAVASMRVGEQSQFLVHYDLAWGKRGAPPRIPPESTILMVITVSKAVDCGNVKEEETTSVSSRRMFKDVYKNAMKLINKGNDYFERNTVQGSVDSYIKAENLLNTCSVENEEEEQQMKKILLKIYTNLTVCYNTNKLKRPESVCLAANKAFQVDPQNASKNAKLLYNRGLAYIALCDYKDAMRELRRAQRIEPNNMTINEAISSLDKKMKEYAEIEKSVYTKFFGFEKKSEKEKKNDEIDPECKKQIVKSLEDFAQGNTASLQLGTGLTYSEKSFLKAECERLGLVCDNRVVARKECIYITRK